MGPGGSLAGGSDSTPGVYDAGNVSVTVNGVQCSTTYGNGDTSSSVASNLANAVNSCGGSPVSASVSGTTVNLVAKTAGASTNYSLSSASSSTQGFASPSFTLSVSGPNLTGGNDQGIGSGTIYSNSLTYAPNGNILAANDSANGSWTYGYDALNRLTSAQQSGQPAYTYVYDAYGNRLDDYLNGQCTAAYTSCLSFDANNHINNGPSTYDAAGNVTSDAMHFYYYDAENRLIQVDGPLGNCAAATACYKYDAVGNRTEKVAGGMITDYIYDTSGRVIAEHDFTNGWWARGEVYADGKHIATYANGTIYFDHADWLGSERVRSGLNGQASEQCANLPFGDGMNCTGGSDTSPIHFTGQEHDTESGLDNFLARYDSSGLGRFMSPDPENAGADPSNPQSWNMYSYVQNNPLNLTDPTGMGSCNPNTPTYVCVSANAPSLAVDTEDFLVEMYHFAQTALTMQVVGNLAPTIEIANVIRHGPPNPTCVDAWAVGGAGIGVLVGEVGVAADGLGEVVTVPAGGMGGTALGTAGGGNGGSGSRKWKYGSNKSPEKWANQLRSCGWTEEQFDEAIKHGQQYKAQNNINPAHGATRFVNPTTGQSVVIDDVTGEVIHVGGPEFKY